MIPGPSASTPATDGTVFARVRQRLGELETGRRAKHDELAALEAEQPTAAVSDVDLLDELPLDGIDLVDVPDEHLRLLFEGFRLHVGYDPVAHRASVQVTIVDDALGSLDTNVIPLVGTPFVRRFVGTILTGLR